MERAPFAGCIPIPGITYPPQDIYYPLNKAFLPDPHGTFPGCFGGRFHFDFQLLFLLRSKSASFPACAVGLSGSVRIAGTEVRSQNTPRFPVGTTDQKHILSAASVPASTGWLSLPLLSLSA